MTHDELLWAINSVVESGPCETVGHYSSAKALRAVIEACKSWENQRVIPISYVLGAIDKELK